MTFVIKAAILDTAADVYAFDAQKAMYKGTDIAAGDEIFIFASENEGGQGLIARGVVTSAAGTRIQSSAHKARTTPRISITVRRTATAVRSLGRRELKPFRDWNDGRPETELAFKLYRQATNKIVGVSSAAAAFLHTCFS